MLKANGFIGLALLVGVTIVGIHSCNTDYTKTDSGATLTRIAPTPRTACFASCLNLPKDQDAQACVTACDHAHPVLDLDGVTPCPDEDAPAIKPITAKKKSAGATKFNFAKMGTTHHHKFKAKHHHKYNPHKHSTNHAPSHSGPGHSGPQKIPSHGAPPHLTGPPPGCR
jgi:hypothetical protein